MVWGSGSEVWGLEALALRDTVDDVNPAIHFISTTVSGCCRGLWGFRA